MIPQKVFQVEKTAPRGNVTQSDLCFRNLALIAIQKKSAETKQENKGKRGYCEQSPTVNDS